MAHKRVEDGIGLGAIEFDADAEIAVGELHQVKTVSFGHRSDPRP